MNIAFPRLASLALAASAGACASVLAPVSAPSHVESPLPPPTATPRVSAAPPPDESFREHPPAAEAPHPVVPPAARRQNLRNGVPVVVVRQPSPYVAIRIVAAGGLLDVGPDKVEVVSAMVRSMRAGSTKLPIRDLEITLASLVMPEPDVAWSPDAVTIAVLVPVSKLGAGMEVLAELALRPSFEKTEFERWREQDALSAEKTSDFVIGDHVLRRVLFGSHGYGGFVTAARTRGVKRTDVVALHARLFDASRLSITVAGGAEEKDVLASLEAAFGAVPRGAGRAPTWSAPRPPAGPRLVVVDKPGMTIATIAMGTVGPAFGSADGEATSLALDTLVDRRFGRFTTELRDRLGHVAGIASTGGWMAASAMCAWQARAPTDRVAPTLLETDRILRDFAAKGPADDELADVKARSMFAFASWFESNADTARVFSLPMLYRQPDDSIARRPTRFAAVSTSDAKAAAVRYLDADRMRTVIVGDWATLQPSLAALGWGPVELRNVEGVVVVPVRGTRGAR